MASPRKKQLNVRIDRSLHAYLAKCAFDYNNWVRPSHKPRMTQADLVELAITILKEANINTERPVSEIRREVVRRLRGKRTRRQ